MFTHDTEALDDYLKQVSERAKAVHVEIKDELLKAKKVLNEFNSAQTNFKNTC